MSEVKRRVTVTLDPELLEWAERAVQAGQARSVSAMLNDALAERVRRAQQADMLIEQDLQEARERDPEEFERAMEWALGISGGSRRGDADGQAA